MLPVPLELIEGRIQRLRISGDWTFAKGLRPRVELAGVCVVVAVLPFRSRRGGRGAGAGGEQVTAAGGDGSSLTAAALRQLLRHACVDVKDVAVSAVDDIAGLGVVGVMPRVSRRTSVGVTLARVSMDGEAAAGGGGGAGVDVVGAGEDSFVRRLLIDVTGLFWVPEEVSTRPQAVPEVLLSPEDTREWLVIEPFTCQVWPLAIVFVGLWATSLCVWAPLRGRVAVTVTHGYRCRCLCALARGAHSGSLWKLPSCSFRSRCRRGRSLTWRASRWHLNA